MRFTTKILPLLVICLNIGLFAMQPQKTAAPQKWLNDQNDQTDTYAIPLDSSEEEEKSEEKELKETQKIQPYRHS